MAGYRPSYTEEEDNEMLKIIVEAEMFYHLRGRSFWIDLSNINFYHNRTWESLKNRFKTVVLPNIFNPNYKISLEDKRRIKIAWEQTSADFVQPAYNSSDDSDDSSESDADEKDATDVDKTQADVMNVNNDTKRKNKQADGKNANSHTKGEKKQANHQVANKGEKKQANRQIADGGVEEDYDKEMEIPFEEEDLVEYSTQ